MGRRPRSCAQLWSGRRAGSIRPCARPIRGPERPMCSPCRDFTWRSLRRRPVGSAGSSSALPSGLRFGWSRPAWSRHWPWSRLSHTRCSQVQRCRRFARWRPAPLSFSPSPSPVGPTPVRRWRRGPSGSGFSIRRPAGSHRSNFHSGPCWPSAMASAPWNGRVFAVGWWPRRARLAGIAPFPSSSRRWPSRRLQRWGRHRSPRPISGPSRPQG